MSERIANIVLYSNVDLHDTRLASSVRVAWGCQCVSYANCCNTLLLVHVRRILLSRLSLSPTHYIL